MGLTATLLLVVGCSGGLADCREVPVDIPFFDTRMECEAERAAVLALHTRPHDQLFGACVEFDTELIGVDAEIVWQLTDGGELHVEILSVEEEGPLLAQLPQDDPAGRMIRE